MELISATVGQSTAAASITLKQYDNESKVRIFDDLMAYAMRKNDYNSGTQLNVANYNSLYPLIYFDLTY